MHPVSENALNTDTPLPELRPAGRPKTTSAAEAAATEGAAGQAGMSQPPAEGTDVQASMKPDPLPDGQDEKTERMSGAARGKPPQSAGPPETFGRVPQSGAKEAEPASSPEKSDPHRAAQKSTPAAGSILANAPTLEQLEKELKKERLRVDFGRVLRNTIFSLVVVAAVSALIAVLFLPVLRIHGSSMAPTLSDQDIVAAVSVGNCRTGNLIAFYYNNNILIKRVIAGPGDWVEIDGEGNVSVNGQPLDEPYLADKALGNCDITFPYQVPDGRYFVMGDARATSVDSRNEVVGCVSREMIIGRIILRVWPLDTIRLF